MVIKYRKRPHQLLVHREGFPHICSIYTYQNVEVMIANQQRLKDRGFEAHILHNGKLVQNPDTAITQKALENG